ncbi:MAG: TlpA family protein disulfide reductase [Bacteroidales bacterium]|nr:TlpA family protein disulfide reductase [Bacteroidales bacterium]
MKTKLLLIALILHLISCNSPIDYTYQKLEINGLPDSVKVVTSGDLTGSKKADLIFGKDSTVMIYSLKNDSAHLIFEQSLTNEVLKIAVGDVDNDGENELVVVTGRRRYVETEVRVIMLDFVKEEWIISELYEKHSLRPQPTELIIAKYPEQDHNSILVSYFESKYLIETVRIFRSDGEWKNEVIAGKRMAMAMDLGLFSSDDSTDPKMEIVVGRVYGDEIGMVGESYFLGSDELLPSKRGVKAVRIGDGDNDGENEIYVGDGWHQDYGKIARGRLAEIDILNSDYSYSLIEDVKYQYETSQIEIADVNEDGLNEVITRGNRSFRIYQKVEDEWTVFTDSVFPVGQFTIGDVVGNSHSEVIFTGPEVQIYNFGNIEFSTELGEEMITERINPDSIIGNPAPELSMLKWYNGSFAGLYNSKGKVILLDFWATWCGPCIKTFPDMERFQKTYGPKGLQILGITRIDNRQNQADIEAFIENQEFVYPIGLSEESLNNLVYGVGGIPHVVLIDKKSVVRYYKVGSGDPTELEEKIISLLGE